jgi:hypothetical protein
MPSDHLVVIDPFAGSCNTIFWILRHLPNSHGIAFECDPQVFDLTRRNLANVAHRIELLNGDYAGLLADCHVPEDRGIIAFVAPPWGTALDEQEGLDLYGTTPPINEIIEELVLRFSKHKILFAIQVYEKVSTSSLNQIRTMLDWTELRIYDINERGRNYGILLGAKAWAPRR